jgi:hypothetical protein
MNWMKEMGDVLSRYDNPNPTQAPGTVDRDYDLFAQNAPPAAISEGLSAAFRSEHTPEFPQMASQLFGRASGSQKSAMLNMLLATVGPMVLQQILARRQRDPASPTTQRSGGGGLGGGLGDILGNILKGGGSPKVTPDVADQIPTDVVEEVAREAEKKDPSIIDRVSDIYAQQPQLLKVLGGAALAIALGRMAQKRGTL